MTTIIRSIHESTGVSSDARRAVAQDLLFHHPFLNAPLRGREHFEQFWIGLSHLAEPVAFTQEFQGEDGAALVWSARFADRSFQGVSIATVKEQQIVELRVIVRPLPFVQKLRNTMREQDRGLAGAFWELPPGTDVTPPPFEANAPVDAHLPFQVTPDVAFHTPVLQRPVAGEDLVKRIIGHATIIYGGRTYGSRMISGSQALTQWVGTVGGLPIHAANQSTRNDQGRVKAITMFMGPLPTLELFFRQLRPRVETFLGAEYFEP